MLIHRVLPMFLIEVIKIEWQLHLIATLNLEKIFGSL